MITAGQLVIAILGSAVLSGLAAALYFSGKTFRKISYMLDALEDKETNFKFSEKPLFQRRFHRTLNRLKLIFEKEKQEIAEQELFYGRILDHVNTGVIVVDVSEKRYGRVLYSNAPASGILGITAFSNIRQAGKVSLELGNAFQNILSGEKETRVSFYNEKGRMNVMVTSTPAVLHGDDVRILVLNDITDEISHNEEVSWNRLIRVLTHEIMNTVTPIASLSRTLSEELDSVSDDRLPVKDNLRLGLDTISESSRGLIRFVESYRSLTRVSPPVRKAFYVRELIERVRNLTKEQFNASSAVLSYVEKSDDILLYADQDQIAQIIVNMLKNALQAGASHVEISAEIDFSENVVLEISNDGQPIPKENLEEIFVPFYTTKSDGTGIGLSISRQIMRLHNGSIALLCSTPEKTVFQLKF